MKHHKFLVVSLWSALLLSWSASLGFAGPALEIFLSKELAAEVARPGRVLVAFAPANQTPRFTDAGPPGQPLFGIDIDAFTPEQPARLDEQTFAFPKADAWQKLPAGKYRIQAVFMQNQDLLVPTAPGNLRSAIMEYQHDPAATMPFRVILNEKIPEPKLPERAGVIYHSLPSKLLSTFHGRPMVYRFAVILPSGFEPTATTKYPLVFHIGGFGSRYTSARGITPDERFLQIVLDGAGPWGDPYQVNSANNGPYGDALVHEVIPFLETTYRGNGKRFTTGGSTGGWVSLALQVFYPDTFHGCWSQCPDGVDFRAFQLTNLARDENMYVNRFGFERPARRTIEGDVVYTVRHESRMERAVGRGNRWELSGQQWASWNAVYGPQGADGLPRPLWDNETGRIDRDVLKHWEKYDLRLVLETNWNRLGPKLADKIHIWVGDADDYFLNNGVHYLKATLDRMTAPKFEGVIEIAPRRGHTSGWNQRRILNEMQAAAEKPN